MLTRYVNTVAHTSGDGSTNGTGNGGTNSFVSLRAAFDWINNNNRDAFDGTWYPLTEAVTIYCEGSTADTLSCTQADWSFGTTATKNILITCSAGNRHSGKWDTSKYRLEVVGTSAIYNNYAAHVTLEWLQVKITHNASSTSDDTCFRLATANNYAVGGGGVAHKYYNCIAYPKWTAAGGGGGAYGFSDSDPAQTGSCVRVNCIAWSDTDSSFGFSTDASAWARANVKNYNCTAYVGYVSFSDDQICYNCIADGTIGSYFTSGSPAITGSNNYSYDGSGPSTNLRSGSSTTHVSFVNTSTGDLHLNSGDTMAKDYGLSDPGSGLYSTDIDGQTRSGSWDIGADEYQSGQSQAPRSMHQFRMRNAA